ncbi:hypothetical protein KBC80_04995 [Candidatus Woesebacteria bacterium]|jgi:hypothetical protein|nr:hypothetical protein [Candidatus Woesebacteria bacterium]
MRRAELRKLEDAYNEIYALFGYTSPTHGDKRHKQLACRACNLIFFDGDPEKNLRTRRQFIIAKERAVFHGDHSNHTIVFIYTERSQ